MVTFPAFGAVAQLGERLDRTQEVRGSSPLSSITPRRLGVSTSSLLPLGVTGNTPDSGSGESWFDPRRGNSKRDATMSRVALFVFASVCHRFCHRFSRHHFDIMRRDAGFTASRA